MFGGLLGGKLGDRAHRWWPYCGRLDVGGRGWNGRGVYEEVPSLGAAKTGGTRFLAFKGDHKETSQLRGALCESHPLISLVFDFLAN